MKTILSLHVRLYNGVAYGVKSEKEVNQDGYARQWYKELTDEEKKEYGNLTIREEREAYLFMHDFEL